jgi:toxin ParE1/3/4
MNNGRRAAIWSSAALADLDGIWDYYVRVAGQDAAHKLLREIDRAVSVIEAHPNAGRARGELCAGVRSFATNPHVIFYRLVDEVPEIIRVLDGRRDIEDIFADGDGS